MFYIKVKPCHKTYKRYLGSNCTLHTFFCYHGNKYSQTFKVDENFNLLNDNGKPIVYFGQNWKVESNGKFITGVGCTEGKEFVYTDYYKVCEISRKPILIINEFSITHFKELKQKEKEIRSQIDDLLKRR